ncbi:MAG: Cerebroside-sulfatase, partial [Planctomycetales bacterium]|nr:Cerebroside-sulfatase [Planctomycetales bacterium]
MMNAVMLSRAICLCAGLMAGGFLVHAEAARIDRPNIIFVMVDDLGPEWVSCYGAEDVETPNIDDLATNG